MIHWLDSFMSLFGYKRPEVWEAERKEHDVTFPAPQAFPDDMKPPPGYRFKEPRKRSNVRSKRSQNAEGSANVRSASAHDEDFPPTQHNCRCVVRKDVVFNKRLTLSELRKDSGKCHAIYQMVDAFTDEQIANEIGATVRAVREYRLLVGWRRR